jgi:hypothetical protein
LLVFKQLIINGLSPKQIHQLKLLPGYKKRTVYQKIRDYWGDLKNAKKIFRAPILEHLIRIGASNKEIAKVLNVNENKVDKIIHKTFNHTKNELEPIFKKFYLGSHEYDYKNNL